MLLLTRSTVVVGFAFVELDVLVGGMMPGKKELGGGTLGLCVSDLGRDEAACFSTS